MVMVQALIPPGDIDMTFPCGLSRSVCRFQISEINLCSCIQVKTVSKNWKKTSIAVQFMVNDPVSLRENWKPNET